MTSAHEQLHLRRTVAALAVRGMTLSDVARQIDRARHHLHEQVRGRRPMSVRSREALRAALGPEGWAYATGQSDMLPAPPLTEQGR